MAFDPQPCLRGELLELRPLRSEHWPALFAVASDPMIWEQHPDRDRYEEKVFREFFRVALESGCALVATDLRDGQVIGSSRFHAYDEEHREVAIGWTFLARSHWGGRYNGEMKRLMIQHAFASVDHVVFSIGPRNHRSRRAIERIGGVEVGSRFTRGHESIVYRISKPWVPPKAAGPVVQQTPPDLS